MKVFDLIGGFVRLGLVVRDRRTVWSGFTVGAGVAGVVLVGGLMSSCAGIEDAAKQGNAVTVNTPFPDFPWIDLQAIRIDGAAPDRFRMHRPFTANWFDLADKPDAVIEFSVLGVQYRAPLAPHTFTTLTGWAPQTGMPPHMFTLTGDYTVEGDYSEGREGETVRIYMGSDYRPDNAVTNVTIGGRAASARAADPHMVLMWDDLPLGVHEVRFDYEGEPYQARIEILEAGGMLVFYEWDLRRCHGDWIAIEREAFPAADEFGRPDGGVIRGGGG